MADKKIKTGNELIAKFMGGIYSKNANAWGFGNAKVIETLVYKGKTYNNVVKADRFELDLKYHNDWNWLMPVVEKIENLEGVKDVKIYNFKCEINMNDQRFIQISINENGYTKINAVWTAVVKFIKKYNNLIGIND